MLADTKPMSVASARELLRDTSRMSSEQIDELQAVVATFQAKRPRNQCAACGSMIWAEHSTAAGASVWACSGCHRAPMSHDEWQAQRASSLAQAGRKAAAIKKLAAKELEPLIAEAIEARAAYIETIAALGWLIRKGHGDARAAKLVGQADLEPVHWPEAASASASGGRLVAQIAALENDE